MRNDSMEKFFCVFRLARLFDEEESYTRRVHWALKAYSWNAGVLLFPSLFTHIANIVDTAKSSWEVNLKGLLFSWNTEAAWKRRNNQQQQSRRRREIISILNGIMIISFLLFLVALDAFSCSELYLYFTKRRVEKVFNSAIPRITLIQRQPSKNLFKYISIFL